MAHIHFSHANGIPAGTYRCLFENLAPHTLHYLPVMGAGKYRIKNNWWPLAHELIAEIEQKENFPLVGMGHSLGGVITLLAGQLRPDLFERIILMDPPLLPWSIRRLIRLLNFLGPGINAKFFPLAKKAARRRDFFENIEEARSYWSQKTFFKEFEPKCFEAYLEHGLEPAEGGGLTLRIPKELETRIFATTPHRLPKSPEGVPVHYLYATGLGSIYELGGFEDTMRRYPNFDFIRLEENHMFPVEKPKETAKMIKSLVEKGSLTLAHQ